MIELPRAFFIPVLALLTIPASADVLYSNGPINGTNTAYDIDAAGSWALSDSFVLLSDATVTGLSHIGIWVPQGETLTSLNWTISTDPGDGGTIESFAVNASPSTASLVGQYFTVYDIYNVSFSVPNLNLTAGTYYLTLENAIPSTAGHQVFWDDNDGSSLAFHYLNGALFQNPVGTNPASESFEIDGTPEPGSVILLCTGLAAIAMRYRIRASRA